MTMIDNPDFPEIVCLCGSTRFEDAFKEEQFRLTVEEQAIVLTVAGNWKDDHDDVWDEIDDEEKERLDSLHFRKIELADRIHVLNVDGYVGDSTRNEIEHALETGTEITWLEPENIPSEFEGNDRQNADDGLPEADEHPLADFCALCGGGYYPNLEINISEEPDDEGKYRWCHRQCKADHDRAVIEAFGDEIDRGDGPISDGGTPALDENLRIDTEPATEYSCKEVMLRAERHDSLVVEGYGELTVSRRTETYYGPKLECTGPDEESTFMLTAASPAHDLWLWRAIETEGGLQEGWELVDEVTAEVGEVSQYDICPHCGEPLRTLEHEQQAAVGLCNLADDS